MRGAVVVGVLLVAGVMGACEEGDGSVLGPSVIGLSLSISPVVDTIFVADTIAEADTVTLVAELHSIATGTNVSGIPVAWSSSVPQVATVAGGVVTAHAPGTTTITAAVNGLSDQARVSVVRRVVIP